MWLHMSGKKLDKIDLKIIQSLKNDARRSITELAKDAGVSRPTAMKRLERLMKDNDIQIDTGINIRKLGFRVGCVGIEVKGAEAREKVEKVLLSCPRVLMVLCPFEKISFSVYVYGENQESLRSTIYSLSELPNTDIAYVNFSDPPLHPKTFTINTYHEKGDITPCGRKCSECYSYEQGICIGCPAVVEYKGPL
jgi:Lrp/AsnC family leucine-responsive transcriptional regulator